jgi:hypothetical protein
MNPDTKKIEEIPFVDFGYMAYELTDFGVSGGSVTGRRGT